MNSESANALPHEPRLNRELRAMLQTQRVAALGTLNNEGKPFVSMVPFAIEPQTGALIIHVSLLAPHTRNLLSDPAVSVMVMQSEMPGEPVHALPRVSLDGIAARLQPDSASWQAARSAYLGRFPDAQIMTELGDFSFVAITVTQARQVAGFGSARPLEPEDITSVLKPR
ncbi:pyridoxamine 5'-phosphate oxidase family protein [Rhodoferax sp.]|uniref:HugZ family pyridoxamine 5'-phosphate oxidase n=1 Tax=Rhodoferax sp. TaxID=50421 RepID=UPI00284337B6|nr:pyridoxamine 5'-phosphate oxidase family protein [Rhodoferax sp.]MDR3368674.1 pyridoxamine 5'-phosphate oxidase family protein [Rhodoferax sp.]